MKENSKETGRSSGKNLPGRRGVKKVARKAASRQSAINLTSRSNDETVRRVLTSGDEPKKRRVRSKKVLSEEELIEKAEEKEKTEQVQGFLAAQLEGIVEKKGRQPGRSTSAAGEETADSGAAARTKRGRPRKRAAVAESSVSGAPVVKKQVEEISFDEFFGSGSSDSDISWCQPVKPAVDSEPESVSAAKRENTRSARDKARVQQRQETTERQSNDPAVEQAGRDVASKDTASNFDRDVIDRDAIDRDAIDRDAIDQEAVDQDGIDRDDLDSLDSIGFDNIGFDNIGFERGATGFAPQQESYQSANDDRDTGFRAGKSEYPRTTGKLSKEAAEKLWASQFSDGAPQKVSSPAERVTGRRSKSVPRQPAREPDRDAWDFSDDPSISFTPRAQAKSPSSSVSLPHQDRPSRQSQQSQQEENYFREPAHQSAGRSREEQRPREDNRRRLNRRDVNAFEEQERHITDALPDQGRAERTRVDYTERDNNTEANRRRLRQCPDRESAVAAGSNNGNGDIAAIGDVNGSQTRPQPEQSFPSWKETISQVVRFNISRHKQHDDGARQHHGANNNNNQRHNPGRSQQRRPN